MCKELSSSLLFLSERRTDCGWRSLSIFSSVIFYEDWFCCSVKTPPTSLRGSDCSFLCCFNEGHINKVDKKKKREKRRIHRVCVRMFSCRTTWMCIRSNSQTHNFGWFKHDRTEFLLFPSSTHLISDLLSELYNVFSYYGSLDIIWNYALFFVHILHFQSTN